MSIIEEIKGLVDKFKLNPSFNNRFDFEFLKKESQRQIPRELCTNIVV